MAKKTIHTSELRHPITFQSKELGSVDAYGQRTQTWGNNRSMWAKIEVKSADENVAADRKSAVVVYTFTVRFVTDINTLDRISYRGEYYSINALNDEEGTRKYLTIEAIKDSSKGADAVV